MVGYILLAGHIIGSFLNGFIYRKGKTTNNQFNPTINKMALNDIVYDSIISIVMVGGYIIFASVLINLLTITNILPLITNLIVKFIPRFKYDTVYAFLCGLLEITNGLILLGKCGSMLATKILLSSILIAFSGMCILLQSFGFLHKTGIKKNTVILQKTTQSIVTAIVTALIIIIVY